MSEPARTVGVGISHQDRTPASAPGIRVSEGRFGGRLAPASLGEISRDRPLPASPEPFLAVLVHDQVDRRAVRLGVALDHHVGPGVHGRLGPSQLERRLRRAPTPSPGRPSRPTRRRRSGCASTARARRAPPRTCCRRWPTSRAGARRGRPTNERRPPGRRLRRRPRPGRSTWGGGSTGRSSIGLGPSITGSSSVVAARSIVSVTGRGGAHVFGQSVPARSSRRAWPGSNVHDVASISSSTSTSSPTGHRRRLLPRVAVREVQHVARDERRGAVGEDVAELRRQVGDRLARGDAHPHPRRARGSRTPARTAPTCT